MAYEATTDLEPEKADRYAETRQSVQTYFDQTATQTWARLTSDAPVSGIRETVRAGRAEMRALLLSRLPNDLSGRRVLDAGCGPGQMTTELARRGAEVHAVDVSPALIDIARRRLPEDLSQQVTFSSGDMCAPSLGAFDHVIAMDSLIYYTGHDIAQVLAGLERRTARSILFTVAPKTTLLMAMWYAGKLFPRSDRSPVMIPQARARLAAHCREARVSSSLRPVGRIATGFYISEALELRA